ncbi:MAG: lytic transglycosylase domain-containing protein [Deltaproteobacteria bacterium]|nr:lytic transglycosylase domain-containing protein [Deltaproteobacteria bacterium]
MVRIPKRRSALFTVAAATALALACGCGAPAKKHTTSPSGHAAHREPVRGKAPSASEDTRAATLGRQGGWGLTSDKVREVSPLVVRAARENRLPEDLVYGIIWVESRFNPKAVSPVGARGLMQLMPKTAGYLAGLIDWRGTHQEFDPEFNIAAGSYYIARLIDEFNGDVDLALAAYNAGPTNVRRWMRGTGLPPVSVEYFTMVQTARSFFKGRTPDGRPGVTDGDLDRLGLAILIAGLSTKDVGLDRPDDPHPF